MQSLLAMMYSLPGTLKLFADDCTTYSEVCSLDHGKRPPMWHA